MKKLLILGGGQLARFLVRESHSLALEVLTASPSSKDPAGLINPLHYEVEMKNLIQLKTLIENADLITFESEFYPAETLKQIAGKNTKKFYPSLECLGTMQDRLSQKECLLKYNIPTLPYLSLNSLDEFKQALKATNPLVLKSRYGGYDGYGTHIIKSSRQLKPTLVFSEFIAEPYLNFKRELAVTVFRNAKGQTGSFPLVEWKAKDNKCYWVNGPIKHKQEKAMLTKIFKMMKAMNYVGALSIEFFEDTAGNLFVNELAPRVHNSCHYSLDACSQSQFYIHLLAGLNLNLPKKIETHAKAFAMVNLIGKGSKKPKFGLNQKAVWVYNYMKSKNRKGRKLGHINTVADTKVKALNLALKAEKLCQM